MSKRLRRAPSERVARLPAVDERQLDLGDVLVEALLRRANEEAERADRRAAEDHWDQGALLNELVALTRDEDAVVSRFLEGPDAARERMKIARATTRWLAGVYGLARIRLGLRILDRLGLATFDQLEARDLTGRNGTTVRFPGTVQQLADVLQALDSAPRQG